MGTSVRDLAGLALHALPPRSRSRQRHGSALGRSRAPVRSGSRRRSSSPSCSLTEKTRSTEPAAIRWHARFAYETNNVDIRESVAVLALLTAIPANRLAASALAELFSRRRSLERCAEALVSWARAA
jgi:hypothetical protein